MSNYKSIQSGIVQKITTFVLMKRILLIVCIGYAAFAFTGCKNDLKLLAPYKDITVVYGLLDQGDTTHYIRINKAYEGPGNALTMAAQYDSINYPIGTLTVQLQDINSGKMSTLGTTMNLPVSPGIFSYPNQVEYFTKDTLNVNDQYKLIITNNKSGKVVTGSTYLLPDLAVTPFNQGGTTFPVSWYKAYPTTVSWTSIPNGDIYQMTVRFYYSDINGATTTHVYADWVFATVSVTDNTGGDELSYSYNGSAFLQFLKSVIPANGDSKICDSLHVIFSTGSQDFCTYSNLSQPSLGINQDKPFYTDLSNGIGIFSSRHTQVYTRYLNSIAIDSIRSDPQTSNLGF